MCVSEFVEGLEYIKDLMSKKLIIFDVNKELDDGCSLLHIACIYESSKSYNPCLETLLKLGANLNAS